MDAPIFNWVNKCSRIRLNFRMSMRVFSHFWPCPFMGNVDNPHVLWMVRASRDRETASKKTRGHFDQISYSKYEGDKFRKKTKFDGFGMRHAQISLSSCTYL